MNTNTVIGWEPTPAEAQYLYDRVVAHSDLFTTTGDMSICIRIMSKFRTQFAATHRQPPMEYVLNILREYKSSLFPAHSGVGPNFGPNHNGHFVDDTLHHTQVDFSYLQHYVPQSQHSLDLNAASFGNHPLGLDQHRTNYTDYLNVDMQFPNPPAQSDVQNNGHTTHLQVGVPTANVQIDGPTAGCDTASADERSESAAEPIGDDAQVRSVAKTSHKRKGERNVFYGSKVIAAILYAKQDNQINARVDARLELQPELQRERVKVLAEERSKAWKELSSEEQARWTAEADKLNDQRPDLGSVKERLKLLTSKFLPLQANALEAFSFPIASIAFTPPSGMEPAKANIIYTGSEDQQSLTDWLGDAYGEDKLGEFMDYLDEFAKVVHNSASNKVVYTSEDKKNQGSAGRSVSKREDPLGAYWSGKLSKVPDPSGLGTQALRRVFRAALVERWNECGYAGKVMPWLRIREKPHNFIQPEFLEEESAGIKEPELYDTDTLRDMVRFFFDHQEGEISYDRGLIFLPCGTGSELYYPTKKGKGRAKAKATTPAFDAATTPAIGAPTEDAATPSATSSVAPLVATTTTTHSSTTTATDAEPTTPIATANAVPAPAPTTTVPTPDATVTAKAPTTTTATTTATSGRNIKASVNYLATAKAFLESIGKISKSKDPRTDYQEAEALRQAFLTPGGLEEVVVVVQTLMEGHLDLSGDYVCMEEIVRAKYGPEADLQAIITSIAANFTTTADATPISSIPNPVTTNPPATTSTPTSIITASTANVTTTGIRDTGAGLVASSIKVPNERGRRRKKGGEPVEVSLGPPPPPVPTRTRRTAGKPATPTATSNPALPAATHTVASPSATPAPITKAPTANVPTPDATITAKAPTATTAATTTTSGRNIEASVDYSAMAKAFLEGLGQISESKDPRTEHQDAEGLRQEYLRPDGLKEATFVIQRLMGGYLDYSPEYACMQALISAKYGPEANLQAIVTSFAASVTTTDVATNPPARRRRKKGGEPVEASLGPPPPPVPTRTLRGTAKRNAEQAALTDSGSSTSTRPKKTPRSE